MKIKRLTWLFGTTLLAATLIFTACKDPNETGLGILPEEDLISTGYIDTFTVFARTIPVDSVLTGKSQQQLFGTVVDPEFGRLQTGFYTQFSIENNAFLGPPDSLTLDSVVLYLDVFEAYGRLEDEQRVEIYELTEEIPEDSVFSNDTLAMDRSRELSNGFTINFGDIGGLDELRIPLDAYIGNKLLSANPDSNLVDNSAFREYFQGIYMTATPTNLFSREPGAVFYTDLASSTSRITLYYHQDTVAKSYDFQISSTTNRFHNVTRTEEQSLILGTTLAANDPEPQYHFVQSGGYIKMFVKFPHIDSLEPVGINKAELVLTVEKDFFGSNDRFAPPATLFAYLAEPDSLNETDAEAFSSADFDAATNTYSIRLTNYVMQVVNQKLDNDGLILIPSSRWFTMNRAILGGAGNPLSAPVLKVTYTTLPGKR